MLFMYFYTCTIKVADIQPSLLTAKFKSCKFATFVGKGLSHEYSGIVVTLP